MCIVRRADGDRDHDWNDIRQANSTAQREIAWLAADLPGHRTGEIELGFDGKPEFLNPMGIVQGGFLSAMLDDTMGPLIFVMTEGRMFATTIDLHVHFLRPVKPGPIMTKAQLTQLGKKVAFAEGQLFDSDGRLSARATCSALLLEFTMPPSG